LGPRSGSDFAFHARSHFHHSRQVTIDTTVLMPRGIPEQSHVSMPTFLFDADDNTMSSVIVFFNDVIQTARAKKFLILQLRAHIFNTSESISAAGSSQEESKAMHNSTSNGTWAVESAAAARCMERDQLRTAVTILAVLLATSVMTGIIFAIYKSKYWEKKGAVSRQEEMEALKLKNDELERRIQNFEWDNFFRQGHVRASKRASEKPSGSFMGDFMDDFRGIT
jgi:hypothetical protein